MPLVIKKKDLPAYEKMIRENERQRRNQEIIATFSNPSLFFQNWLEGVEILKAEAPGFIESYKEDLRAMGINNVGDFAKWTAKCIGVTAATVFGGLGVKLIVGKVIGGLGAIGGTMLGFFAASSLQPIVTTLFQSAVSTGNQILNFNIMQTDNELYQQIIEKVNGMYGLLGTTVGSAVGWLVCGALPGSIGFRYNKAVATAIAQDLNEDARSELYSYIAQITRLTTQTIINTELVNRFTSLRRELKNNPESTFSKYIRKIIGEERFKKWGDAQQQPWSIKKDVIDAQVAKEKDPNWKQFYENALEGFSDSCIEAGAIVANNLDTYIASQKIARSNTLGKVQTVRIQLGESVRSALYNDPRLKTT
jgi:hypothetical protein